MKPSSTRTGAVLLVVAAMAGCALPATDAQGADRKKIVSLKADRFEIPGSVGINMIRIEPGAFTMGSPEKEPGRRADETQRKVKIPKPFYMAETEITQAQYIPVVIPDYEPIFTRAASWWGLSLPEVHCGGPFHTAGHAISDSSRHPMEGVTWAKAVAFCEKTTERERKAGRLPRGYAYRLPTEAEWEYACRAGSTGRFNVDGELDSFAVASGRPRTSPVKVERKPNAWGLYDMHGNVYEWCLDTYGKTTRKVARGGCYITGKLEGRKPDPAKDRANLRSAARGKFDPDFPLPIVGFRIVLAPEIAE
jgi:formylglycine-generating enzyme required for sulfatase activity